MTVIYLFIIVGITAAGALLTEVLRRHALKANMMDLPGARSSHALPTPRGAGLGIGMLACFGALVLYAQQIRSESLYVAVIACTPFVMLIGWLDDRRGLPAWWRALAYLAVAAGGTWLMSGFQFLDFGSGRLYLGGAGLVLGTLGLAWLINLYNFMDGTDGLAGVEAVTACLYAGALFALAGDAGAAWLCAIIAAACTGFLFFNWPPASVFMGDAGSCAIGLLLGLLALHGEETGAVPLLCWMILLALFICDATLTLVRRMWMREEWYSPHRTHAYQLLTQAGLSHRGLVLSVMAINLLVLGPLALFAALYREYLAPATAVSFTAVSIAWLVIQRRRVAA